MEKAITQGAAGHFIPLLFGLVFALFALAEGCSTDKPRSHRDCANSATNPEVRGRQIMEAFLSAARDPALHDKDPELDRDLGYVSWSMAWVSGYDFKWDIDAWEYWYLWITKRDTSVIGKCLASPNSLTIELGVDIAMSSGEPENVSLVLEKYPDILDKGRVSRRIAAWARGEGVESLKSIGPKGEIIGGYKRSLKADQEFWVRFMQKVGWAEQRLIEPHFAVDPTDFLKVFIDGYHYVDTDALANFSCNQVLDILCKELVDKCVAREKGDRPQGLQTSYCGDLCLAIIDHCQSKGVAALLRIYKENPGQELKGRIAYSLAERDRIETISALIAGLQDELSPKALSYIDVSLQKLTGRECYQDAENVHDNHLEWRILKAYWEEDGKSPPASEPEK